jgi:hypothetical protein
MLQKKRGMFDAITEFPIIAALRGAFAVDTKT